jgi:serine/threonine protein kinase/Tol biopolymer transport system component
MVGRTLGSYQIVEKLGEGGMGEVWRARDTRLGRFVAVKVLPPDLARDPDRRQRFEAEARAVGALNHPNIVAVYDVGADGDQTYMVSELVEGESLRSLIRRGPLSPRRLTDIASQIADGLAAAHGVGIVHRDLKPENIMVTRDGRAKILDFGLAKQIPKSVADETATAVLSQPGIVMGTVGYMSPEQVRGETVDRRSDIFSFGCILYELATGKRAFDAGSAAEVLSAILKDDPSPVANPGLDAIIRRCLEKQPDQRFQSAADLAFALRSISSSTGSQPALVAPKPPSRTKWLWPVAMAAIAILLVAGGYLLRDRTAIQNPPEFERLTFRQGHISAARFTSDGQNVIYAANWEGAPGRTYLVTPGNPESRDLMMPENSQLLSVSAAGDLALLVGPFDPDGSGTLARNSITGGQTRELLEHVMTGDWTADGKSGALSRRVNGKWRLEYPEGTVLWEAEWPAFGLRISPDGERVAFCVYDQGSRIGIMTIDRAGKRQYLGVVSTQISMAESARLFWSPDSREIWFRSLDTNDLGTIYGLSLTGKRRIIARMPGQITLHDLTRSGQALISTDATRVGILGVAPGETAERDLSVLDAAYVSSISLDGSMILANALGASGGPHGSIYLRRTDGSPPVRLSEGNGFAFSPDGKWLAGYTTQDAVTRKFVLLPTGTGEEKEITVPGLVKGSGLVVGWLPGEQSYLVMGALPGKKPWQLFAWDAVAATVRPVSPEGMSGEGLPMLSPDAKRYYHRGPDAAWHVYPVSDGKQVDMRGLTPHDIPAGWFSDNQSIYVRTHTDTNKMMRVAILDIDTGERKPWKEIHPTRPVDEVSNLHVTPDGRAYAYNYQQATSDLYLMKGLK